MNLIKKIKDDIELAIFHFNGKKPWKTGYSVYKKKNIVKHLNNNDFNVNSLKTNYGYRIDERIIEYPWLFSILPSGKGNLLDAGSALNFDFLLNRDKLKTKNIFISTLSPESSFFPKNNISYIYEDLRDSCFKDNFFDYIVSISTIEHIGLDNTYMYTNDETKNENIPDSYIEAIIEFMRILKPNGKLYITVPFGIRKNHGWFQVFDAHMIDVILNTFSPSEAKECYFKYEPNGWTVATRESSKEATCFDINVQKGYDPDFAAFSRAIVCLEITK
jgi:SAM-dependent methyltransferase